MTPEEALFEEAKKAIQAGDLNRGRDFLTRLLKTDQHNPDYWLWMSSAVSSRKERAFCLNQALAIDPKNQSAQIGLTLMGEPIDKNFQLPAQMPRPLDWKTSLELQEANQPKPPRGLKRQFALYTLASLVVLTLIVGGVWLATHPFPTSDNSPIMRWSLTPPATATQRTATPAATSSGPVPLWARLQATFTPTPLYVATPHNRIEAYTAAMKAYDQQNWPRVVEYLNQVLMDEPNSPDVLYHLGDAYRFQKLFSDAKTAYDKAAKIDPTFAPAYLGLGRVMLEQKTPDPKKAQEYLLKSVDLNPSLYEAYFELTRAALLQDDPGAALTWINKLDPLLPNSGLVEYYRAQIYLLQGKAKLAQITIEKSNKLDPSYLPTYLLWGDILQQVGDYSGSLEPLQTYLTYDPNDTNAMVSMAEAYLHLDQLENAITTINSALEQDPKNGSALVVRGEINLQDDQADAALADFEAAIKTAPKSFYANLGRGKALLAMDTPGSAYMQFMKIEDLAKTDQQKAELLYWRAYSLQELGETAAAIRDWQAFLAYPADLVENTLRETGRSYYDALVTPTPSVTPTVTPSPTRTGTPTITPSPTRTANPTITPTPVIPTPTK